MLNHNFRRFSRTILLSGIGIAVVVISSLVFLRLGGSHEGVTTGPRLILGPNPASPGSVVTVSGFDFPAAQPVKVYFQNPSSGAVNTTTNAGGFFNTGMKLPDHIDSGSRVYAVSGSVTSFIPLQVMKPSLATNSPLSQDSTAVINGAGFLANSPVTLTLSNGPLHLNEGSVTADRLGRISSNITLPDTASDAQNTLAASDTAHNTALLNFKTHPNISVSPQSGYIGSKVTVSGVGFTRDKSVTVYFRGKKVATAKTSSGRFKVSFVVPGGAAPGSNTITVTGSKSGSAKTSFNVVSRPLQVPRSGSPGSKITVSGGTFKPGDTVVILLIKAKSNAAFPNAASPNVSSVGVTEATTTARSDGTIRVTFRLSGVTRGHYWLFVIDRNTGASTSYPFTVF